MSETLWTAVDSYISSTLVQQDGALHTALQASEQAGLPAIAVSEPQGKFLHVMALAMNAKNILEIGTLGGYSAIWMARALQPGGKLTTLEISEHNAQVAKDNFTRAGVADKIDIRVGSALETLPSLIAEKAGPFDLIFIDADKTNIPAYFEASLKLARRGGIIIVDNTVRKGAVLDDRSADKNVSGIRQLMSALSTDKRVSATMLQTVGAKGYDGFIMAVVS